MTRVLLIGVFAVVVSGCINFQAEYDAWAIDAGLGGSGGAGGGGGKAGGAGGGAGGGSGGGAAGGAGGGTAGGAGGGTAGGAGGGTAGGAGGGTAGGAGGGTAGGAGGGTAGGAGGGTAGGAPGDAGCPTALCLEASAPEYTSFNGSAGIIVSDAGTVVGFSNDESTVSHEQELLSDGGWSRVGIASSTYGIYAAVGRSLSDFWILDNSNQLTHLIATNATDKGTFDCGYPTAAWNGITTPSPDLMIAVGDAFRVCRCTSDAGFQPIGISPPGSIHLKSAWVSPEGEVLVGRKGYGQVFHPDGGSVFGDGGAGIGTINAMGGVSSNDYWIVGYYGVAHFRSDAGFVEYPNVKFMTSVSVNASDDVWFAGDDGLWQFDGGGFTDLTPPNITDRTQWSWGQVIATPNRVVLGGTKIPDGGLANVAATVVFRRQGH